MFASCRPRRRNLASNDAGSLRIRHWHKADFIGPINVGGGDDCQPFDLASMGSMEAEINWPRVIAPASVQRTTGAAILGHPPTAKIFSTRPKAA